MTDHWSLVSFTAPVVILLCQSKLCSPDVCARESVVNDWEKDDARLFRMMVALFVYGTTELIASSSIFSANRYGDGEKYTIDVCQKWV